MKLIELLAELKRRRVLRVAGAYVVAGMVAVGGSSDLFPALHLPYWTVTFVAALVVIGFPVAIGLAWAFDWTPEGLRRAAPVSNDVTSTASTEAAAAADGPAAQAATGAAFAQDAGVALRRDARAAVAQDARAALRGLSVFLVVVTVLSVAWYSLRRGTPGAVEIDAEALVIVPFRFAADPSLEYLREGMVDLLAAKFTGEGGPRAVDARPTLSAWRRTVGAEDMDMDVAAAASLARTLGAGQVLVGGIIGTPGRFTLSATLHGVDGTQRARAEVEGSADELTATVDRLVAQLLSIRAGEETQRLGSLTTASLPALRAYLAGQAEYRRGRFAEAMGHYREAVAADSTFGLAALGLWRTGDWAYDEAETGRGLHLAWTYRDQLPGRDRSFLIAAVGAEYPAPYGSAAQLRALQSYVTTYRDHADAWYQLGDALFHRGGVVGYPDALERSMEAFRRALSIDPAFSPARLHLIEGLIALGDTATVRLEAQTYFAHAPEQRAGAPGWLVASVLRDTAALAHVRRQFDTLPPAQLRLIVSWTQQLGIPPEDAYRALEIEERRASSDREHIEYWWRFIRFQANAGRFSSVAAAVPRLQAVSRHPLAAQWHLITAIGYPGASGEHAAAAVVELEPKVEPLAGTWGLRRSQRDGRCMFAQWAAHAGNAAEARRHRDRVLAMLAEATDDPLQVAALNVCVLGVDAEIAALEGSPAAPALLGRLDSVAMNEAVFHGLLEYVNLVAARLHAARGNDAAALAAIRRRDRFAPYALSTAVLMSARLMARTGDRDGAVRAYMHYLALRPDPDPGVAADEVRTARRELAALVGEPVRR